jgi:hypothetical protein
MRRSKFIVLIKYYEGDKIKADEQDFVGWINLAHEKGKWRAVVKMVINFRVA